MTIPQITLRSLALVAALSAAYFWHDTGKQKAEQFATITQLRQELNTARTDIVGLENRLAGALSQADKTLKLLEAEKGQLSQTRDTLADSRRENATLKDRLAVGETMNAEVQANNRQLRQELESTTQSLGNSVPQEKYLNLQKQLADSKSLAEKLQRKIDDLVAVPLPPVTVPPGFPTVGNPSVSHAFGKVVTAQVKQIKGDKVLLTFGTSQGAKVNTEIRLQNGLDFVGIGRVIFTDEHTSLVALNPDHEKVRMGSDLYLMVPENQVLTPSSRLSAPKQ